MAAANWVCIALLLSLCLGMCSGSGNRVGLSNKDAKELVNLNQGNNINHSTHEVGTSSSYIGNSTVDFVRDHNCVGDSCAVDCDVLDSMEVLVQTVKLLSNIVDDLGQNHGMNMDAKAPESG